MTTADEPTSDEAADSEGARHRRGRGALGWLRSFAVLSIVGAVLAAVVLVIGVTTMLSKPAASRDVLPFQQGPAPTGADPRPESSPSASASASPSRARPVVSSSRSPSRSPSPSPSPPHVLAPVRYEAEQATISRGRIDSDHAGFSGTGFVDYDNVSGSFVQWTVTAPSAGKFTLRIGYANASTSLRPMDVLVNGSLVADELSFTPTGSWTVWQARTLTVTLVKGTNTIRAVATSSAGGPNVDYLETVS